MEGVGWPEFFSLFRWALLAAALAACVLPVVGCFLFVRRTSFHGLALPPLAARPFANSMRAYFFGAAGLGLLQVVLGTLAGFWVDLPLGPAMVGCGALLILPGLLRRS